MEIAVATNPLAILKPSPPPRLHTLQEYLRREERATERHEYYNGKIIKLPMARGSHNIIAGNVITQLNIEIEKLGKDFLVFTSNQKVYLPKLNFGLYPDALVVAEKPKYWDNNEVLLLNPILIVEVLSKSTRNYDQKEKFLEYKTLPSFKEYVLIEQNECSVESRFREEQHLWRETFASSLEESIHLKSIGCSISLAKIYKNIEFPPPLNLKLN
jgi:Uma2 family endonuclease